MNTKMRLGCIYSMTLILVGACCTCPPSTTRSCIDFEDQAIGSRYDVGDSFTSAGVLIDVIAVGSFDNWAEITAGNQTTATGNDLRPQNVGVHFNLPNSAFDITMNFADLGGNTLFLINGDSFSTSGHTRVVEYDGQTVGGVLITVMATQQGNNWLGDVMMRGSISSLTIVGQELWIDEVCYMH